MARSAARICSRSPSTAVPNGSTSCFRPARSISSSAPVTSRRMSRPTWGWMDNSASIGASAHALGAGAGYAGRSYETARRAPLSGVALLDHAFPGGDPDHDEAEAAGDRQARHEFWAERFHRPTCLTPPLLGNVPSPMGPDHDLP